MFKKVKWLPVVYIYPVEPNLCEGTKITDSFLGEYMVDEKTSIHVLIGVLRPAYHSEGAAKDDSRTEERLVASAAKFWSTDSIKKMDVYLH